MCFSLCFPKAKAKKSCWNGTRWQNKLCWKSSHFVGSHPRRSENENTIVCFCHTILMLIQSKNKTKKKRWRKRGWHINHSCQEKQRSRNDWFSYEMSWLFSSFCCIAAMLAAFFHNSSKMSYLMFGWLGKCIIYRPSLGLERKKL